jgi:hypothetical protein
MSRQAEATNPSCINTVEFPRHINGALTSTWHNVLSQANSNSIISSRPSSEAVQGAPDRAVLHGDITVYITAYPLCLRGSSYICLSHNRMDQKRKRCLKARWRRLKSDEQPIDISTRPQGRKRSQPFKLCVARFMCTAHHVPGCGWEIR